MPGVASPAGFASTSCLGVERAGGLGTATTVPWDVLSPGSLGFFTAWQPQGSPVDTREPEWLFMTQPQTPFSITSATSVGQSSHKAVQIQEDGQSPTS